MTTLLQSRLPTRLGIGLNALSWTGNGKLSARGVLLSYVQPPLLHPQQLHTTIRERRQKINNDKNKSNNNNNSYNDTYA